jgi:hypothetical protein
MSNRRESLAFPPLSEPGTLGGLRLSVKRASHQYGQQLAPCHCRRREPTPNGGGPRAVPGSQHVGTGRERGPASTAFVLAGSRGRLAPRRQYPNEHPPRARVSQTALSRVCLNPKTINEMAQTTPARESFEHLVIGSLDLFRISSFGFRIWNVGTPRCYSRAAPLRQAPVKKQLYSNEPGLACG